MENKGWVMPTHIIAGAGIVLNDSEEILMVKTHNQVINVVLVGSGPLEDKYVSEIGKRRMENLSEEDRPLFQRLVNNEMTDEDMKKLSAMFEKSDNYCLQNRDNHRADRTDSEMHNRVWSKMSCFSEVRDSILMWSYYANSHKGICIEYDLERLDLGKTLNREIVKNFSKVHYSPIRSDNWDNVNEESALNFLSSKADVWAHEHEWRIICETQEEYLPLDCISNIYIGANFSTKEAKYQKLVKAVNTHDRLKIYKCELNSEKYQIDFNEIYDSYTHTLMERERKNKNKKTVADIA